MERKIKFEVYSIDEVGEVPDDRGVQNEAYRRANHTEVGSIEEQERVLADYRERGITGHVYVKAIEQGPSDLQYVTTI